MAAKMPLTVNDVQTFTECVIRFEFGQNSNQ